MSMQHTQGPWELVNAFEGTDCAWVEAADGTVVATGFGRNAKGNARLIAAAPELLAALEQLLDYDNLGAYERSNARSSARAAIAKARGRR